MTKEELLANVVYDEAGLVPVIVQDAHSKKVRMLAYMNGSSLAQTLSTGLMTYYSRSRETLWVKGETSGYYQHLKGLALDCDGDTLLAQVDQVGGISCHTGHATCFYRELEGLEVMLARDDEAVKLAKASMERDFLASLSHVIALRKAQPKEGSYTNYLLEQGLDKILKKVGEETTEAIVAAKGLESQVKSATEPAARQAFVGEMADVMYHLSVLLASLDVSWDEIAQELARRAE